jgi:hypothetical protein
MSPSRVAAVVLGLLLLGACSDSGGSATARPTSDSAGQLARQACGAEAEQGGPLPAMLLGERWLPDVGTFDAVRRLNHTNARLAGEAAARDAAWGPLASAWRDLADIYETARAEYAAALTGRATAEERRHLRQLQEAAATAVTTIREACRNGTSP